MIPFHQQPLLATQRRIELRPSRRQRGVLAVILLSRIVNLGCSTNPDMAIPTSQVGVIPFHHEHHGGRHWIRTSKAFTPDSFQDCLLTTRLSTLLVQDDRTRTGNRGAQPSVHTCYTTSCILGTDSRIRTYTPLLAPDSKSGMSTVPSYRLIWYRV